jgi:aminoglycoside phosphotransferase (APT) family kinase protein
MGHGGVAALWDTSMAGADAANTTPHPASGEDLDLGALEPWLSAHVDGFRAPLRLEKFAGGQSNPTYRIDAESGSYVLRRKPFGAILPSAHAVDREYRLISALHPTGFPVARPYALCQDPGVIGADFYVMEFAEGRTFWDGKLPDQSPDQRRATYQAMIRTLAEFHAIDPQQVGLGDYGRPGNYFARQVSRWTTQYRAAKTDDIPEVDRLIEWLPTTVPEQTRASIIHGDYRIDNIIFDPTAPRIRAVLDWELSTLGDPLADFTYLALNWVIPAAERGASLKGIDFEASGIPTLEEATSLYCELTGRDGLPELDWFFAYNLFRLLGIVQGIKKRFLDGNASSAEAEQAGSRVPQLAQQAWAFAQRAGAQA